MNPRDIFPRPLQYLIAVAEHGSFTRAAESLYVSQPTLSQQIKQLEEMLDLPLLDRSGKTVRLTNAGETYLYHAKRAYAELEAGARAVNDVENLERGSLRLGWTPITDYLTCSLLDQFNRQFPGIKLSTREMTADQIENALLEDQIDFGIAFSKPIFIDAEAELKSRTLFREKLYLAIGNAHPLAGFSEPVTPKQFSELRLVALGKDFALRQQIDSYCYNQGVSPQIAIETDSLSVMIEMVQVGSLATVLPQDIINSQCGIYGLPLDPGLLDEEITILCRRKSYKSPASVAFSLAVNEWCETRKHQTPVKKIRPCPLSKPDCDLNPFKNESSSKPATSPSANSISS